MQAIDEKLGRMVTRVVLPHVVMYSRHHYGVSCWNWNKTGNLIINPWVKTQLFPENCEAFVLSCELR